MAYKGSCDDHLKWTKYMKIAEFEEDVHIGKQFVLSNRTNKKGVWLGLMYAML